jgi:trehalose/maltose transport system substrate-binding protein
VTVSYTSRQAVAVCGYLLVLLAGQACRETARPAAGITLTLIHHNWADREYLGRLQEELRQFTKSSEIRVQLMPAPAAGGEQFVVWGKLLESGASGPDVYSLDVIWPGVFADDLLDLRPYLPAQEIAAYFPELIANNTVNGRLLALPHTTNAGVLFYRVDLLHQYGYAAPPKTWDELQEMAARIQRGERANGHADFWGYVWQGGPSEALTCNALEWQASEGGGAVIENGTATIDNPHVVRAWERAANWVGSISPPGVVEYKEWDAFNLWQAGQAAFMRNWLSAYSAARGRKSPVQEKIDIAALPRGRASNAATLGGYGYGVSRHSGHPREAAQLVRFLCGRDQQRRGAVKFAMPPTISDLYNDREVLGANPYFSTILEIYRKGVTSRPSAAAGKRYMEVSKAWYEAVHAVLTRKEVASEAATALQRNLVESMSFQAPAATGQRSSR